MEERELEMAENFAQAQREQQIRAAQEAMKAQYQNDFDGVSCVRCGNDIPPARLSMGRIRCTECQTFLEKIEKLHGR